MNFHEIKMRTDMITIQEALDELEKGTRSVHDITARLKAQNIPNLQESPRCTTCPIALYLNLKRPGCCHWVTKDYAQEVANPNWDSETVGPRVFLSARISGAIRLLDYRS